MSVKGSLTNEQLTGRFDNAFALVNYAISFAKNLLKKGEAMDKNVACEVLDEIVDNRDLLEFVDEDSEDDEEIVIEVDEKLTGK